VDELRRDLAAEKERALGWERNAEEERAAHAETRGKLESVTAQKDGAYRERDQVVALAARMARLLHWPAWLGRHVGADWEDDWRNIVFITLPSGQVSWHVHDSELHLFAFLGSGCEPWDGHGTDEKYRRCQASWPPPPSPAERRVEPPAKCAFPGCQLPARMHGAPYTRHAYRAASGPAESAPLCPVPRCHAGMLRDSAGRDSVSCPVCDGAITAEQYRGIGLAAPSRPAESATPDAEEPCLCAFAVPGATRESMAVPGPQHDARCAKHRPEPLESGARGEGDGR
jgi:hypothetical protein